MRYLGEALFYLLFGIVMLPFYVSEWINKWFTALILWEWPK